MIPFVEEFQFDVGPYRTPADKLAKEREWLPELFKTFKACMMRFRKVLKKITISWLDDGMDDLFDRCVDSLHKIDFLSWLS